MNLKFFTYVSRNLELSFTEMGKSEEKAVRWWAKIGFHFGLVTLQVPSKYSRKRYVTDSWKYDSKVEGRRSKWRYRFGSHQMHFKAMRFDELPFQEKISESEFFVSQSLISLRTNIDQTMTIV